MNSLRRIAHTLKESGPAPDRAWAVRALSGGGWPAVLLARFLRVRVSPDALGNIRALPLPLAERAGLFRQAISLLNVGETYKTTGLGRTRLADEAILRLCAGRGPVALLDIGVSDGSASVELLERLRPARAVLTDLHPALYARGPRPLRVFLDGRRRLLGVKLLGLYVNLSPGGLRDTAGFTPIDTANPLLAEVHGVRAILPFNALADRLDDPVQVIKCANVLNRAYFNEADLRAAVSNLSRSLAEGGLLVISHNNAKYAEGEAWLALRKAGGRLVLAEEAGAHECLDLFREGAPCA